MPDLAQGLAEIARVLRPRGRLVAVTYSQAHLGELFDVVGQSPIASTFSAETGAESLRECFDPVERRDISGRARFPTTDAILGYLAAYESFGHFSDVDLDAQLRHVSTPFDAYYRHSAFVAHKSG